MEDSTTDDPIIEPAAPAVEPAAGHLAPDSPFGMHRQRSDDWIRIATGVLAVLVIGVAIYLGVVVFSSWRQADAQSPSARAVANLAETVKANPNMAMARVRLAEAMMANGQQTEAIAQLQAALEIEKENVSALTDLGLIAMDRREWTKAEQYWTKLITILSTQQMAAQDSRLADVYYYLGTTFVEQKRYEEAVANLGESIKIKRDSSPVHYMLSVAYQRLGYVERQREELDVVLAFDPEQAQANYDKGMLLLSQEDAAGAAEYFRIAQDNAPGGVTAPQEQLDLLGNAPERMASALKLQATDPKTALADARIAAALDPTNVAAVRLIADLAEKTGDTLRATNAWQRVLEMLPGDVQATDAIKRLSANAK